MTGIRTYFGAAALAAIVIAAPAHAQDVTEAQKSAIRSNCRSDFMSKCSSVTPGGTEAFQCLKKNEATLSGGCRAAVDAIKLPGAAPAAAPRPGRSACSAAACRGSTQAGRTCEACNRRGARDREAGRARTGQTRRSTETRRRHSPAGSGTRSRTGSGRLVAAEAADNPGGGFGAALLHRRLPDFVQGRSRRRRPRDQVPVRQSAGAIAGLQGRCRKGAVTRQVALPAI